MRTGMSRVARVSAPAAKDRSEDAKRPAVNPRIIVSSRFGGAKLRTTGHAVKTGPLTRPRPRSARDRRLLSYGEGGRVPGDLEVSGQSGVGAVGAHFQEPAPEGHVARARRGQLIG